MALVIHAFGATSVGRVRDHNEDNYLAGRTVFAVADGMGGHAAGEVASEAALGPLRLIDGNSFRDPQAATDALAQAVSQANDVVLDQAAENPELRGMGTTLTTVMVRGSRMHLAHVGDSRAYLLRQGMLDLLTEDHTLVAQLVKEGRLTEEQAATHPQRSVITRAIGVEAGVQVDTMHDPLELQAGDQVLLCSDGLTGPVSESLIAEILASEPDGDTACRRLIDAANAGGGPDNITCVLLRVEGDEAVVAAGPVTRATSSDDDATAELGDPSALDAARLAELAGGDPDADEMPAEVRQGRGRRIGAIVVGVLLIAAVLVGGALLLLNRSYFVGLDDEGTVGIYRGLQGEVFGISLATLVEQQDLTIDDLPERLHSGLENGLAFPNLTEAEMHVDEILLEAAVEADPDATEPAPTPTEDGDGEPKDEPDLLNPDATTSPSPTAEPSPTST